MKKHRVFISYCHGIRSQKIVEEVVCALKKRCIEVVYDAELKLGQHLTPFMERIQDPTIDKVLCVVDKKYAEHALNDGAVPNIEIAEKYANKIDGTQDSVSFKL